MDILFWSGGKDAYLALEFYRQRHPDAELSLLTTYSQNTGIVPHQNIPIENIRQQAETLDLPLITVPLPEDCPNKIYLEKVDEALCSVKEPIEKLVFGDWYLQDIREWREKQFTGRGYDCIFPIWEKELHELLPVLLFRPVEVRISAVSEEFAEFIKVGEDFNQQFIRTLPKTIDPMGERGEFHTEVVFHSNKSPSGISFSDGCC